MSKEKLIAFRWFGGKFLHLDYLLPLFPKCEHFVDVFGGSAAVIINKEPCPIETYNDLNNDIYNFFYQLRNNYDEFYKLLSLTPYSRTEHDYCKKNRKQERNDLERARMFYVAIEQSFSGILDDSWAYSIVQKGGSASIKFFNKVENLGKIMARLKNIQIENLPALSIIKKYDSPSTFFYLDPPYPCESREENSRNVYDYEMTNNDHRELSIEVRKCKGLVAISSYKCSLMEELYGDWYCWQIGKEKLCTVHNSRIGKNKKVNQEWLWTNYNPYALEGNQMAFDFDGVNENE